MVSSRGIEEVDSEPKALCLEAPLQDRGKSGELSLGNVKGVDCIYSSAVSIHICTKPNYLALQIKIERVLVIGVPLN